eukprot:2227398-Amphidinium_carterae.1
MPTSSSACSTLQYALQQLHHWNKVHYMTDGSVRVYLQGFAFESFDVLVSIPRFLALCTHRQQEDKPQLSEYRGLPALILERELSCLRKE